MAKVKTVKNLLENGEMIDDTGKAKKQEYPYEDEDGRVVYSLRNRSDDYEQRLAAWKERNGLAEDAEPMEKPQPMDGESATEFMERIVNWTKDKSLWKTAPKPMGYWEALEDWKQEHGIPFPPA